MYMNLSARMSLFCVGPGGGGDIGCFLDDNLLAVDGVTGTERMG